MKARRKAILTAAAVTALFGMVGCGDNNTPPIYGPPPEGYIHSELSETSEARETEETEDSHEST